MGAGLTLGRVQQDYAYQLHSWTEYVTCKEPLMGRLRCVGELLGVAKRDGGWISDPVFFPVFHVEHFRHDSGSSDRGPRPVYGVADCHELFRSVVALMMHHACTRQR
jgi:hypothetical protein